MKKRPSYLLTSVGLLFLLVGTTAVAKFITRSASLTSRKAEAAPSRLSVLTVLQAHNCPGNAHWMRFTQTGTLRYDQTFSASSQVHLERKLSLSTDGLSVRYETATLNVIRSYLLNGDTLIKSTLYTGTQMKVKTLDGPEAASVRFQMATFGLLPILKRISDPATKVGFVGNTANEGGFDVKTVHGSWYFYTNSKNLIGRLQIGEISITFDDYREVEGMNLPFHQKVSKGNVLLYEIQFDTVETNPVFSSGFFKT